MHGVKIRRVHLDAAIDLERELARLGFEIEEVGAHYPHGEGLKLRCSGVAPPVVRLFEETLDQLGGVCISSRKRPGEMLLIGTVPVYQEFVQTIGESFPEVRSAFEKLLTMSTSAPTVLDCRGHHLHLDRRTYIMGVINCTPDSFYAASRRREVADAVAAGVRMVDEGADLLDVGGESTRPGSDPVSAEEEKERVLPVIEALRSQVNVPISIDTYKAEVAREALEAGAHMVNDISGLRFDPEMADVVREFEVPVVVMHMKGRPKDMQVNPDYDDLMGELYDYFVQRVDFCEAKGIPRERVVIDPGIGFGKRYEHNYEIIRRLRELADLGQPVLLGPSRKSFIGAALGLPPEERLEGTAAAVALGIQNGAHIVRVHDVAEMVRVARVADLLAGKSHLEKAP
jgi:dihydropteroate synthase